MKNLVSKFAFHKCNLYRYTQALDAGINVFVVSWWGRPDVEGTADSQGINTDLAMALILAAAERSWNDEEGEGKEEKGEVEEKTEGGATNEGDNDGAAAAAKKKKRVGGGMHIAFHLEPYPGRTAASVRDDVAYLAKNYGASRALLRGTRGRPVYFVYDSYHIPPSQWAVLLAPGGGAESVRGGDLDGVFLGLWLTRSDG